MCVFSLISVSDAARYYGVCGLSWCHPSLHIFFYSCFGKCGLVASVLITGAPFLFFWELRSPLYVLFILWSLSWRTSELLEKILVHLPLSKVQFLGCISTHRVKAKAWITARDACRVSRTKGHGSPLDLVWEDNCMLSAEAPRSPERRVLCIPAGWCGHRPGTLLMERDGNLAGRVLCEQSQHSTGLQAPSNWASHLFIWQALKKAWQQHYLDTMLCLQLPWPQSWAASSYLSAQTPFLQVFWSAPWRWCPTF